MDAAAHNSPFVKQLASSDRHARDNALQSLRTYLAGRRSFDEVELMKLWKGLFFCMWMSDKRPVQQRLASDLAGLVDILPQETVLPFLDAYWKTMAREWSGIDALRMDKFLLLVRRYLFASFKFLSRKKWANSAAISEYMQILETTPLNIDNIRVPNGLRYHVADIYVDELDRVDESREGHMPLQRLLEPLQRLGKRSPTKAVRKRVEEALEDERLADWNGDAEGKEVEDSAAAEAEDEEDEGEEWGGIDD